MFIVLLFWGFYAHRLLNNLAIYALPTPMISFYQMEEAYIMEHAVDPDKRRYASPFEAARHYIDFEKYGSAPYDSLPQNLLMPFLNTIPYIWFRVRIPFILKRRDWKCRDTIKFLKNT
jgi:hypothetical protein